MKILVTGGNGFIGMHVVKELISREIEVISFDTAPPIEHLEGVEYVRGTIMDEFILGKHMRGCVAVFHLAAVLGVKRAETELLKCMIINIQGTIKVLEACVMNQVPHVLITSSSEIFGDINNGKLHEGSSFNPKSGYAISKLAGEQCVEGFRKEYDINYNIVRFFNIYGPGQVTEFVVPRFIKMVLNDIPPSIYGDGKQVRSFCHVSDTSAALVDLFFCVEARNSICNIGNDLEPVTIKELAAKVINKLGSRLEPKFVPFSGSDRQCNREIYSRIPDISKIIDLIGYKPKVMLDEGIQSILDYGNIPDSSIDPIIKK